MISSVDLAYFGLICAKDSGIWGLWHKLGSTADMPSPFKGGNSTIMLYLLKETCAYCNLATSQERS